MNAKLVCHFGPGDPGLVCYLDAAQPGVGRLARDARQVRSAER